MLLLFYLLDHAYVRLHLISLDNIF
jgi:hypothetical protein